STAAMASAILPSAIIRRTDWTIASSSGERMGRCRPITGFSFVGGVSMFAIPHSYSEKICPALVGRAAAGSLALAALLLVGAGPLPVRAQAIPGTPPSYSDRQPGPVPNAAAVDRRFWAPGLDDGYVPQGVTIIDGQVVV